MASWIKLTYSKRLFLWLITYSLLLVGSVLFFQYHREKVFKTEELNGRLQMLNGIIIKRIIDGEWDGRIEETDDFPGLRVSIIESDGRVVYDNSLDALPNTNHLTREEIATALCDGSGYSVRRHSESTGQTYFYSARKSPDGLIVRTAVPYSLSLNELLKTDDGFLWFLGAISLISLIVGYFATRGIGLNIRRLKSFAAKAERGDKIYDSEPFPHDELGEISNHIVRLYASLQQAILERDKEHKQALHEQKEKERIKKQLTNNINHELKTPVASMQVCLETLLLHPEMEAGKRREFLERCFSNSQRLRQLLLDISLITRMEDGSETIILEDIDLQEVIRDVVEERKMISDDKGFKIIYRGTRPLIVRGNRQLWESVFFNLIDNAISYSGGNIIKIYSTSEKERSLSIHVEDNGTGVGEEHLPHLFERFYRVDKGRSRANGGTGLGLSIVKNAVALHGGTIVASNLSSGGLGFRINIHIN